MGRRKTGRDISGWVVLDKPAGLGSTTAVSLVRRAFDARKAGHAGTLDPAATGVLAVALGEATKTVPQVAEGVKVYRFAVRFGAATTTDDAEGETLATSALRPSDAGIEAALDAFRGDILQVPPQVSAVHVDGRRAYALVRAGEAVDLAPRPLRVERLEVVSRPDEDTVELEMVCGKGGYVRAIARDLGARLGCLGHALWLRRLATGPFTLGDAVAPDEIARLAGSEALLAHLLPLEHALAGLPELRATPEGAVRLRHGNAGAVSEGWGTGGLAWASFEGQPLAVGIHRGDSLHPARVFNL